MERRKQLGIYLVLLMLLFGVFQLFIITCAGSSKALSPEEQKAFQDSLNEVHRLNVLKTFSSGFEHYRHGNYERAKPYLRRTAHIDTTNIYGKTVYQHLGRTYIFLNMPDSAEWAFKEGKSRDPEKIFYYTSLGYLFEKQGRIDDAISEYEAVVKIAPDSAAYHSKLGKFYAVNSDNDLAIESLKKATLLNPDDKDSQEILDKLFLQTGDLNEIITQRESMVQQFPEDIKLRMDLADSYFHDSQFENAIEQLHVALSKNPENLLALEMLGESNQQLERYNDAVNAYKKILSINPGDKKNMCNMAIAYTYQGKYTSAMSQINKALRIESNYGFAFLTRGIVYETCAEKCVGQNKQKISFDDKLVYKLAYDQFMRAKNDLEWKDDADRHIKFLQTLIPTTEDKFLHSDHQTPRGACYEWIR